MDNNKAISLARSSARFQSLAAGHTVQFGSIFTTWSFPSGKPVWDTVNVVFYYYDANGSAIHIVVTSDPALTLITNVEAQLSPFMGTNYQGTWSGYTLWIGNTQQTSPVYEATSTWTVPYAHEPYNSACSWHHCDVSEWAGLTTDPGGHTYIVQAGTDSGVYCAFGGCSQFYWSWYEFYPQGMQRCPAIRQGDVIVDDIFNEAIGGGSSSYWDIYLTDYGQGGTGNPVGLCYITSYGFGVATPYYAQFIAERWWDGPDGYTVRLPNFGSFPMTTDMNYQSHSTHTTGYTAYTNGWYNTNIMTNGGPNAPNIAVSGISPSYSQFTQTWRNSDNT